MLDEVRRVLSCELTVSDESWPFADAHTAEIDAHWEKKRIANPGYFNGPIHLLHEHRLSDDVFTGRFLRTNFKSYLYWRDAGFADETVRDAFGSALLRARDGSIILGRQRPGNINAGLTYLPGGFIDQRDVRANATIDIAASISREITEELGYANGTFVPQPGFIVTFAGPLLSIAKEFVSGLDAGELIALARAHIAAETDPELEDVVAVAGPSGIAGLPMPDYARILLRRLFAGGP